ncbi:unnamed protein product [Ambrosiozyma monospora]|uniref:Unnamed protein product n=1 Tax=Ambrosiozyma monospora TaxID=43982 RepID=A0A9W6YRY4_AMBMO|nr:unnamed protein product [Ambrosiozyma monospora]
MNSFGSKLESNRVLQTSIDLTDLSADSTQTDSDHIVKASGFNVTATLDESRLEHERTSANLISNEEYESNSDDEPIEYPDGGFRAYTVVFGSFLGMVACFGLFNSTGAIQAYLNLHQLKGVSNSLSSIIFSVFTGCAYLVVILSGVLFDEYGSNTPVIIGSIFLFAGIFGAGNCTNVIQLTFVFGLLGGSGVAILSSPLTGVITHWFLKNRSKAFGLSTLGGSVGGMAFPVILEKLYRTVGYTSAMRIMAFICTTLSVLSCILVRERVKPERLADSNLNRKQKIKQTGKELVSLSKKSIDFTALKEPRFLWCAVGASFGELSLVCTLTYFATYVTVVGFSEQTASTTLTVVNTMGIVGRYIGGALADKFGCFNIMMIMLSGMAACNLFLWCAWSTLSKDIASIYVFAVFYGFFNSCVLSLSPSCVGSISPTRDFGKRYGTMYFISGVIIVSGVLGGGAIIGHASLQNYRIFSLFCGLSSLLGVSCFAASRYTQVGMKLLVEI